MGDAREMSEANTTKAKAGTEEGQPLLDATKRRVLKAAGADRRQEISGPPASERDADQAGRNAVGAWDTVIALIEAMEASEATALRGRDIRALRRAVRMPARELAKRLGYTESAVYDWETERHSCPPSRYLSLLDAILGWREEQERWMALIHKDLRALHRREE
ncbi:MAG: helix-turn-helix domain-containing protein [Ktedonobacterales bacterium]